jgi:hypothetical protein
MLAKVYGVSGETVRRALADSGIKADRRRSGQASWSARHGLPLDEGDQETGFRWCSECRERKPMTEFYWRKNRERQPTMRNRKCKPCHYVAAKAGADLRANRRKYLYGMTADEYNHLRKRQLDRCAICLEPAIDDVGRGLRVDHDHESGVVRGLLCDFCNRGLGMFKDNPDFIRAAAEYVERGGLVAMADVVRHVDPLGVVYLATRHQERR